MGALEGYADWPAFVAHAPRRSSRDSARRALADVLGVRVADARDLRVEREWTADAVRGAELSWWVGFGPRTRAFLLQPDEHDGTLPGVLALHAHGGVRSTGAEQLVDTGRASHPSAARLRERFYGGRAVANDLARAGFAVLVPDAFSWASRRFDLSTAPRAEPDENGRQPGPLSGPS